MAVPNEELCPDWILLSYSNMHVAKHKAWFKTYTPWTSTLSSIFGNHPELEVFGIGTVDLTTKLNMDASATATVTLTNVLHVPDFPCNAIGQPIGDEHTVVFSKLPGKAGIFNASGDKMAQFKSGHILFLVDVVAPIGHRLHETSLTSNKPLMLSYHWDAVETSKWEAAKTSVTNQAAVPSKPTFDGSRLYRQAERTFLNKRFKSEYKFLRSHGLSIHKDEDREEGRAIIRELMHFDENEPNVDV
ncbi:hypothetical protein FB567DRAFT_605414 [Paraphoma chrysanthemicola]|uniref:Retrovirus-related Pol polyprotein from transposon TNT 1-94-like beta-barrel domain-containing protein n=1 Tax=Paraphoma chrysanthemicola TaxID=798071 RepID=A0A8K0VWV1_9PLEO|nr:hypothetical protein FB567DRAFT_605414 [Paraphoma chrysanthemicola]